MFNAVITGYKRSPFTIANKGDLFNIRPEDLLSQVIKDLINKSNVNPEDIEDIIAGCAFPEGEQGFNIGKIVSFMSNMPQHVSGMTVNRWCGSSMQSVHIAAGAIALGSGKAFICCGVESMSKVPMNGLNYSPHPKLINDNPNVYLSMGVTAENVAKKYQITRKQQDEFAVNSQKKATEAIKNNKFKDEIVPINLKDGKIFDTDEYPKSDTTTEVLATLKTVFKKDGTVTAGNASGLNDGAAALTLMNAKTAKDKNLKPLARIVSWAQCGVDPSIMGTGPIPASREALKKAGWNMDQLDLIEANEAFAAQAISVNKELDFNPDKVNVNGGAIALGHPIGASGARVLVTLLHEMKKRKSKKGLATLCIGGGMGIAMCVESNF